MHIVLNLRSGISNKLFFPLHHHQKEHQTVKNYKIDIQKAKQQKTDNVH